jgi:methionyl-tRNA synthetase
MTNKGKRHTHKKSDLIDAIIKMRVEKGLSRLTIMNFLMKDMGFAQSYAYELLRDAQAESDARAVQNFGNDLKEDIERFEQLYEKAMINKNLREAREVLKEIAKLKGHYTERLQIDGNINHTISVIKLNGPPEDGTTD